MKSYSQVTGGAYLSFCASGEVAWFLPDGWMDGLVDGDGGAHQNKAGQSGTIRDSKPGDFKLQSSKLERRAGCCRVKVALQCEGRAGGISDAERRA